MITTALQKAIVGAIALTTLVPLQANAARYSQVFGFGDSLTDTGRLFDQLGFPGPPYFNGRISNGPIWLEYLVPSLGLSFDSTDNFAYAGAASDNRNSLNLDAPSLPPLPGFSDELSLFFASNSVADSDALYVILVGANDYNRFAQTDVSIPVNNIKNGIQSLYDRGARNFLVPNLPNLGRTPENLSNPTNAALLSQRVSNHNQLLATTLNTLSNTLPGANILSPDLFSFFDNIIDNPAIYGFTNVTAPCFSDEVVCANPETYLFWDGVHPSTKGHRLIGEFAASALGVPEPSVTFSLVVIGIGFLGTRLVGKRLGIENSNE
jgi:phospholipase/lecithinase/hemolysin